MPEDAVPIPERKLPSGENKRRPLTVPAGNNNNNNNNHQPGKITRTVCAGAHSTCMHLRSRSISVSVSQRPYDQKKVGAVEHANRSHAEIAEAMRLPVTQ